MQRRLAQKVIGRNIIVPLAAGLFSLLAVGYIFIQGKPILAPLIFALLISGLVYNIFIGINQFFKVKWISSLTTILVLIIPVLMLVGVLGLQFEEVFSESDELVTSMEQKSKTSLAKANSNMPKSMRMTRSEINTYINDGKDQIFGYLQSGVSSGISMMFSFFLTLIYVFFILQYSSGFKQFIISQMEEGKKENGIQVMTKMKDMIRSYLSGLGLVVVILCVLNSIGLMFFGVKYAVMWGCLAGVLAIIPYVGTIIGSALPIAFAFATMDDIWIPIGIAAYFFVVQQLEGNFITPKIIGNKINVNPFFAILSVVFFGYIWGIAGAILGLPLAGLVKIVLSTYEHTAALSTLMSEEIDEPDKFSNELSSSRYRLVNLFSFRRRV
ncbi:MAG TPA: AI-2E family transporter [Saprospiraceae bacterium]|nr:AI-2E family transporter [Saprospiraceae bacterium]